MHPGESLRQQWSARGQICGLLSLTHGHPHEADILLHDPRGGSAFAHPSWYDGLMGLHQQSRQSMAPRDLVLMPCGLRYDLLPGHKSADPAPTDERRVLITFSLQTTLEACGGMVGGREQGQVSKGQGWAVRGTSCCKPPEQDGGPSLLLWTPDDDLEEERTCGARTDVG